MDETGLEKQYPKGTEVYFKPGPMYEEISGFVDGYSYSDSNGEWGLDILTPNEDCWGYWRSSKEVSLTPKKHAPDEIGGTDEGSEGSGPGPSEAVNEPES